MTDITKRLAKALRNVMTIGFADECMDDEANAKCDEADAALADFDRTAAQEANVQGGDGEAMEILASLVKTVENMRVPQTTADAALQIFVVGPSLQRAQAFLAAPHPTPAPASGEVTDAMHKAACTAFVNADDKAGMEGAMLDALEAATRARQGEGGWQDTVSKLEMLGFNSAETDAFIKVTQSANAVLALDAVHPMDREEFCHGFHLIQDKLLARVAVRSIREETPIPTAAPVPADEGEKK